MSPLSVMALFCEDIREEKGDTVTLVGLLPDTVRLGETPTAEARLITKLCIYARINFDPSVDIGAPTISLVLPDGERMALGNIGSEVVTKAQSDAKANGNLLAGVVSRVSIAGFRPSVGPIKVEVEIMGETKTAAALTFSAA